ncbi:MAG: peptidoglycan DD-metalloendopeptidase family protein [Acidobacteria bacterium]|nr:peptidoglycan DD-metalloendopeptidase family protein [Acidobacteriota bacterium]
MSRAGRRFRTGVLLALVVGMLLGVAAPEAQASHSRRYRELQRKIEETRRALRDATRRENDLMTKLADSDRRRASLERTLSVLNDQFSTAASKLDLLNAKLDRVSAELSFRTAQLEESLAALEDQTARLDERAADIYTIGTVDYASVILGAPDLNSAVVGYEYARSVLSADSRLLDEMRAAKDRIELARLEVAAKKAEVQAATKAQEEATRRIAAIRNEQAGARRRVVAEINYRQRLLSQVRDQKRAYELALQSYIHESDSIAAFLRGRQAGQRAIQGQGGYLTWPVSGQITSGYGWRVHPIYKRRSFHTGIDIGSPAGTTVRVARAGTVLYTGYKGAYGLIALVDHGNAVATMYAHMSQVYVRPGDYVPLQGAVGAVGCTGWCTGPHVHFEVRVNGAPDNPLNWL